MSPRTVSVRPGRTSRPSIARRVVLAMALSTALTAALTAVTAIATAGIAAGDAGGAGVTAVAGRYVALGDSYASGPGIPHFQVASGLCARSDHNYPSLVAGAIGPTAFTDVTCNGAATADMTRRQLGHPPQFAALRADTRVVTLTIGGNDAGFFNVLATCAVGGVILPNGSPCRDKYTKGGSDRLDARIADTMPKVAAVIAGIHDRAPQAVVFVVGYPAILPDAKDKCAINVPLAKGDFPYLNGKIQRFNQGLAAQAAAGGALFVDTYTPSVGHEACQPAGTRWIEGIENVRGAIPIHPNARGMAGMADAVLTAIESAAL